MADLIPAPLPALPRDGVVLFLTRFTRLFAYGASNTQAVSANLCLRYNYHPDSDLYVIYNVGTQFASIAPASPPQVRETRFAVKRNYSWQR